MTIVYHAGTLDPDGGLVPFDNLISALKELEDCKLIFGLSNADPGSGCHERK